MHTPLPPHVQPQSAGQTVPLNDEERKLVERITAGEAVRARQPSRLARRLLSKPLIVW